MTPKQIERAHHALLDSSFHPNLHGTLFPTADCPIYQMIGQMNTLCQKIAKSKQEPCVLKPGKPPANQPVMQINKLAHEFIGFVACLDLQQLRLGFPIHQFNPWVELFLDVIHTFGLNRLNAYTLQNRYVDINNCFNSIRMKYAQKQFHERMEEWNKSTRNSAGWMTDLLKQCLKSEEQIKVFRYELTYLPSEFPQHPEHQDRHIRQLLDKVLKQLFPHSQLGYVWKLTYSAFRGYRYHLMLIVKASDQNAEAQSLQVEILWKELTQYKGISYMHQWSSPGYMSAAIGIVQLGDIYKKQQLEDAVTFMVYTDYFLRIKASEHIRTFEVMLITADQRKKSNPPPNLTTI